MQDNKASYYLAENLQSLRKKKGWSQDRLAKTAEVPRTTLTHIESGMGNPTLNNLAKLAGALGVGIEELLSRPRNDCLLVPANELPQKTRSGSVVYKLLPDKMKTVDIDRMEIESGHTLIGNPHVQGTKEYLTVINGEITVYVAGDKFIVKKGDVLAFPGDQKHSYHNSGRARSVAFSVVLPIPSTL